MSKSKQSASASTPSYTPPKMQLATILSDLNSLRASNPSAARALVSTRAPASSSSLSAASMGSADEQKDADTARKAGALSGTGTDANSYADPDLRRAFKLLELHRSVKLAYVNPEIGLGQERMADDTNTDVDLGHSLSDLRESRARVTTATKSLGLENFSGVASMPLMTHDHRSKEATQPNLDENDEDDEELSAWS